MFEAQMENSELWKRILEAVKDLVEDANLECSPSGIQMQAMDTAHVSLVCLLLRAEGFKTYQCERNVNLGLNLANMAKIIKCANKDDKITLRYEGQDHITYLVESMTGEKTSDFSMKLMDIDGASLGIPEQEYKAIISMPSAEFSKLCRDMQVFGETVQIAVSSDSIKFSAMGEIGSGSTTVKPTIAADMPRVKSEDGIKKEEGATQTATDAAEQANPKATVLEIHEEVTQNFSLKNLVQFTKAGALSDRVRLSLAKDTPLSVEYRMENFGYMRFYLAPKLDEEES